MKKYIEERAVEIANYSDELSDTLPFLSYLGITYGKNEVVIDELDAKIHPILLKHIINMLTDLSVNKNNAQLIFTSHDLSTMNSEVFRRDEIWFVAKGNAENSKLYSLVEFKNEKGESCFIM